MHLLKPKYLAARNRLRHGTKNTASIARGAVVFALTGFLIVFTYLAALWMLGQIDKQSALFFVYPSIPLSLILVFLFFILLFTNTISSLGSLYFSKELNLLLSTPVTGLKFFTSKLTEALFSSSWMTIVFLLPVLLAFGRYYNAGLDYYLLSMLIFIPYFYIPAALSVVLATVSVMLIPIKLRKRALYLGLMCASYLFFTYSSSVFYQDFKVTDLLEIMQKFSAQRQPYLYPSLVAEVLSELLVPKGVEIYKLLALVASQCVLVISFAYLCLYYLYEKCFFIASTLNHSKRNESAFSKSVNYLCSNFLKAKPKAIVEKEIKTISRDLTQGIQLLMLVGVCMVYLYSLTVQGYFVDNSPPNMIKWWEAFFTILNTCVEAFVVTALSSRFAFSSVSREGKSFWIIKSAPVSIRNVLKYKFWIWFLNIFFISSTMFSIASWINYKSFASVSFKVSSLFIVNFGLVGLAIGMGASFARFKWQHVSEVATSFGNLAYMVAAVLLVLIDVILQYSFIVLHEKHTNYAYLILLLFILLNLGITYFSLFIGEKKLNSSS